MFTLRLFDLKSYFVQASAQVIRSFICSGLGTAEAAVERVMVASTLAALIVSRVGRPLPMTSAAFAAAEEACAWLAVLATADPAGVASSLAPVLAALLTAFTSSLLGQSSFGLLSSLLNLAAFPKDTVPRAIALDTPTAAVVASRAFMDHLCLVAAKPQRKVRHSTKEWEWCSNSFSISCGPSDFECCVLQLLVTPLIDRVARSNRGRSSTLLDACLASLGDASAACFRSLMVVCAIEDELQSWRVGVALSGVMKHLEVWLKPDAQFFWGCIVLHSTIRKV